MDKIIFNKKTDKIAIIAPASGCSDAKNKLQKAVELLESNGFQCQYDWNILSENAGVSYFASSKEQRILELKDALLDPKVKIIWAFRGGYGASEMIFDFIDINQQLISNLKPKSKIIIGFSDITVLLIFFLQNLKMSAIHGPVINSLIEKQPKMLDPIISVLSGNDMSFDLKPLNIRANSDLIKIQGSIVGGNLAVICHMIGSKLQLETSGKIVFLEDVNEKGYQIHRYLMQMKNAGLFDKARALILGDFSSSDNNLADSLQYFCKECLYIPVFRAQGIGHTEMNYPIVVGSRAYIRKNLNKVQLTIKSNFELLC